MLLTERVEEEIADELALTPATTHTYITDLFRKAPRPRRRPRSFARVARAAVRARAAFWGGGRGSSAPVPHCLHAASPRPAPAAATVLSVPPPAISTPLMASDSAKRGIFADGKALDVRQMRTAGQDCVTPRDTAARHAA